MPKPRVYLCFDTEDPIHPEADDALLRLARLYEEAGVAACFFLVAERTRLLGARGRRDVLDALRAHEINYHGNYWFEFPEAALVYGEREPWDEAVNKARAYETAGLNDIAEITGQFPVAFAQHQHNHSPATSHALRQAGVRVWNHTFGGALEGIGWVMNLLTIGRAARSLSSQGSWGRFQFDPDEPQRRPAPMQPENELKAFQTRFDTLLEEGHSHINILGHPTCWAVAEWWGWHEWPLALGGAWRGGFVEYPQARDWERGVLRAAADSEAHFQWTAQAARWLASRHDIEVTTFGQTRREYEETSAPWLEGGQVLALARAIQQRWQKQRDFDWNEVGGVTLSAAAALWVLAQYAEYWRSTGKRPDAVQVRRALGPVEEVLQSAETVEFSRASTLLAARQLVQFVQARGYLPPALRAHNLCCGPAELLIALGIALSAEKWPATISVEPANDVPACAAQPCFSHGYAASTNAPARYEPQQIRRQSRLQAWSFRPAVVNSA